MHRGPGCCGRRGGISVAGLRRELREIWEVAMSQRRGNPSKQSLECSSKNQVIIRQKTFDINL